MRIALIGGSIKNNFGGPSIILGTVKVLREFFPHSEIIFLSCKKEDTYVNPKDYLLDRIAILPRNILKYVLFLLRELKDVDMVLDIWGIAFSDMLEERKILGKIREGIHFIIGKLLKKCVIKYTTDIGPLYSIWSVSIVKFFLNIVDIIFARSKETARLLKEINVKKPIVIAPDAAFIADSIKVNKYAFFGNRKIHRKKIAGISVSHTITKFEKSKGFYIKLITEVIEYLIKEKDMIVILIPNEVYNGEDDSHIAEVIYNNVRYKDHIIVLRKKYTAKELKGIIGLCDILIASRYHSIIAALSQGIPTLAIGWHHKYYGVMDLVGLGDFVYDISKLNLNDILKKIDYMTENYLAIKEKILNKLDKIVKEVFYTGDLIKKVYLKHYLRKCENISFIRK